MLGHGSSLNTRGIWALPPEDEKIPFQNLLRSLRSKGKLLSHHTLPLPCQCSWLRLSQPCQAWPPQAGRRPGVLASSGQLHVAGQRAASPASRESSGSHPFPGSRLMASPADPIFGWLWCLIVTSSCVNKGGWVTMTAHHVPDYLLCRSDPEIFR